MTEIPRECRETARDNLRPVPGCHDHFRQIIRQPTEISLQLNPYLSFNGQCEAAFKFYERCPGGKIAFKMTNGKSPMAKETPPERHHQTPHARLEVDGHVLTGSDAPPERHDEPKGFTVAISPKSPEEAERIYAAMSEKGTAHRPIQGTFWAVRFGMLNDPFGIPWMINGEKVN